MNVRIYCRASTEGQHADRALVSLREFAQSKADFPACGIGRGSFIFVRRLRKSRLVGFRTRQHVPRKAHGGSGAFIL